MSDPGLPPIATGSGASPLPEQTVGYLEFFKRWDTPLDDDAARAFSRLVRGSPDFETFQALAPATISRSTMPWACSWTRHRL